MLDMTVLHALPDRIRIKAPVVRNEVTARRLESGVKDIDGIHWVRVNPKCAGLVVRFDGTRHSTSDIIDIMQQIVKEGHA